MVSLALAAGFGSGIASARSAAAVECSFGSVKVKSRTGSVSVSVRCVSNGRRLGPRVSYSYTAYDARGNICGDRRATGTGSSFTVRPPGAGSARVVWRARAGGRVFYSHRTVNLGGTDAECAALRRSLPPSSVCGWSTDQTKPFPCGSPYQVNGVDGTQEPDRPATWPARAVCVWATPPTLTGRTISAGHLACVPPTYCWLAPLDPRESHPTTTWLGQHFTNIEWRCSNGDVIQPSLALSAYPSGSQQVCGGGPWDRFMGQIDTAKIHFLSFRIPANWGGRLAAVFFLEYVSKNVWEQESAYWDLSGTVDPCPDIAVPTS